MGLRVESIEKRSSEVLRRVRSRQSSGKILSETVPGDHQVILLKHLDCSWPM